jgi:hypothetical protein
MDDNPYQAPQEDPFPPAVIEADRSKRREWLRDRIYLVLTAILLFLPVWAITSLLLRLFDSKR